MDVQISGADQVGDRDCIPLHSIHFIGEPSRVTSRLPKRGAVCGWDAAAEGNRPDLRSISVIDLRAKLDVRKL